MARAKKPAEEKPKEGTGITIDVNDYVRTRDQFVAGLATLQDAIQNLSTAYIKHTNAVLGDSVEGLGIDLALSKLGENPILGALATVAHAGPSGVVADDKKERKKRQHDPNAPKRPLTPFFLYMQTARPIIANDLGPDVPKGQVSEEGTKRWKLLGPADKDLWTDAYKQNLRLYHARMRSYKSDQNLDAKNMSDAEALAYAEANNIGIETSADAQLVGEAHDAGALVDEDEDAEGEPDKEPTPPPAVQKSTPKPKSNRKAKGGKAAAPEAIVPAAATIVPPKPEAPTPAKAEKRKRTNKKDDVEEPAAETPKSVSKPRKKKAKGDS